MHTRQLGLYVVTIATFVFFTLNLTEDAFTTKRTSAPRNASRHCTVLCQNADFAPHHKKTVWTMLTDDPQYVLCALKLGHSLRAHTTDTRFDMVVMELATKPLGSVWDCLREVGWQRCVVDRIAPLDEAATRIKEPRWLDQFTKLHLWGMTMYETLLYLDSDTLTLRSIGHLLHRNLGNKSIAVAAQTWPSFSRRNSGLSRSSLSRIYSRGNTGCGCQVSQPPCCWASPVSGRLTLATSTERI
jgi:hypothetical protein